jgi:hypothetical protein
MISGNNCNSEDQKRKKLNVLQTSIFLLTYITLNWWVQRSDREADKTGGGRSTLLVSSLVHSCNSNTQSLCSRDYQTDPDPSVEAGADRNESFIVNSTRYRKSSEGKHAPATSRCLFAPKEHSKAHVNQQANPHKHKPMGSRIQPF